MGNIIYNHINLTILDALNAFFHENEEEQAYNSRRTPRRQANRKRNRNYALEEVEQLSNKEFSSMFRMNREGFNTLYAKVCPFLHDTNEEMARVSSDSCITKKTKLYATLRWLAGGSSLDICFGCSSCCCNCSFLLNSIHNNSLAGKICKLLFDLY